MVWKINKNLFLKILYNKKNVREFLFLSWHEKS